ncbi:MAG: hypothetical protein ACI4R9_09620 [Kiritimatiellia bacterium]
MSLEAELALLPKGTIIRRTIRGADRFYHQWRENGITKSRYLSPGEIMPLRARLERRKYLLSVLGAQSWTDPQLSAPRTRHQTPSACFRCDVLIGHLLAEYAAAADYRQQRDCFNLLRNYLHAAPGTAHHAPFLVGPEGIGKTTLLRQLIQTLPPTHRAKAAYLRLTGTETAAEVTADLTFLRDLGFRFVFLDNAEHLRGLAGTGLTLILAGGTVPDELREVVLPLDISFIPFREYAHLTGLTDVAKLVECGGTLGAVPGKNASASTGNSLNDRFVLDVLALAALRAKNTTRTRDEAFLGTDLQKLRHRFAEISGLADEGTDETARIALLNLPMHRRFAHAQTRITELLTDPILDRLGAAERKIVSELLLSEMRIRLLEDVIWNELRHTHTQDTTCVHRVPFAPGAYGFVIADEQELTCEVVTLTTDAVRDPAHVRYLDDPIRLDILEHRYGTIIRREVLYNGRDARLTSGVAYRNLAKYLTHR